MSARVPRLGARVAGALAIVAAAVACSPPAPPAPAPSPLPAPATTLAARVRVANLKVGRAIGADRQVSVETDAFSPKDTVYISVATEGSSPGITLRARWTFQDGQVVDESSQSIAPAGSAVTEFHISKPDGFPAGSYKVEVFLDGASVGSKDFKVS